MSSTRSGERSTVDWLFAKDALVDHFQIMRPLGRGGMGEVYLARDTRLGRKVALKVIDPRALGATSSVEQFLVEARITARFNHPHIITVYAVGEHQGVPYLALEYLEGQTLRQRIAEEPPGLKESLRIGREIASALHEAHRSEVLHRDLKPENVLIPRDGRLRVLDFGLARALGRGKAPGGALETSSPEPSGAPASTAKRVTVGTPHYMAPEQWLGQEGTVASDLWALGVILCELVHGRRPYQESSASRLGDQVIAREPVSQPRGSRLVPEELAEVIQGCLDKDPARRPSALEVAGRLEQILSQGRARPSEEVCPFRGLLPFDERHLDLFFGREAEIASFVERTRQEPVLPVVGPSGSGKSSFIQAGVIPRLREQGPLVVVQIRPGSDPFGTLAARLVALGQRALLPGNRETEELSSAEAHSTQEPGELAPTRVEDEQRLARELLENPLRLSMELRELADRERSRVLLLVDQLEELYTLTEDESLRHRFMNAICEAADDHQDPVRVVFTLRDDFLGRLAEGARVREVLSRVTVVRSPDPEALREIVSRPLEVVGYRYQDPSMVAEMVEQVHDEPACLPLLQSASRMLWDRRDVARRLLCREAYREMGGVAGALAHHADGVLQGLSPVEVHLAREMMLRLVTSEGTRRVLSRARVMEGLADPAEPVLRRLIAARLITVRKAQDEEEASGAELELAHESLVTTWARLARWVEESREDLAFLAEAGQAAELWEKRGRREEEVWQGELLFEARLKLERCTTGVSGTIRGFLEAGTRREKRRARVRRSLFVSAFLLLGLVAIILAMQTREARRQRSLAESGQRQARLRAAESQGEGARAALAHGELLEARAKLRTSLELQDSPLARTLWWRLKRNPLLWEKKLGGTVYAVAFSSDGQTVGAACQDQSVYLLDVRTRAHRVLRALQDQVLSVAFSPRGNLLAAATIRGQVGIWDLDTGRFTQAAGHTGGVSGLSFSPDGRLLASASSDRTVRLWRVPSAAPLGVLEGHGDQVHSVSIDPSGKLAATGSRDTTVRIWDLRTQRASRVLRGHLAGVWGVSFSPDGRRLASGSMDRTVRIWDLASGETSKVLRGHSDAVIGVGFDPDGRTLASGSSDSTIRLWDAASGRARRVLSGHSGGIWGVGFARAGGLLASASEDKTVRLWRLGSVEEEALPGSHQGLVSGLAFSPDGKRLASASADKTIRLWSVATGESTRELRGHTAWVSSVAFSPDGKRLASGGMDRSVRLWNAESGAPLLELKGHDNGIVAVSFSPDGTLLASASLDKTVRLWRASSGELRRTLLGHSSGVFDVSFSADGTLLASASADASVGIWRVASGRLARVLKGHTLGVEGVSFAARGHDLVSGGSDKMVWSWNADSGVGRVIARSPARVHWLGLHPDGTRVGLPLSDGTAQLREIGETARERSLVLRGHHGEVNNLRFSPDGRRVATSGDDGTVRLWETDTGRPVWRAPLLLAAPPELFTHRGWQWLDGVRARDDRGKWRQAIALRARAAAGHKGSSLLCVRTFEDTLELWVRDQDRLAFAQARPGLTEVWAMPEGCLTRSATGQVQIHRRSGAYKSLDPDATAVAWDAGEILVAAKNKVVVYGPTGARRASYPADVGVTAMLRVPPWLVLGYAEGNLDLVGARGERPSFAFEDVASGAVTRLLPGPMGTVIAGYASGSFGIWSLEDGKRLHHGQLHGPISQVLVEGRVLYLASELGQYLVLDLGVFLLPYCQVMREIWRSVPVIWEEGHPVVRTASPAHRCLPFY